jgi:hypothetical protein
MFRIKAVTFVVMLTTVTVACGGGSSNSSTSPTSPSSQFPNVAGTYTGQLTFRIDNQFIAYIPGRLVAVQSGSQVTINSSMTFDGVPVDLPAVTGNINATGYFTVTAGGSSSNTPYDQRCGYVTSIGSSLTFSGNTAQYVQTYTTDYCGVWNLSGALYR